MFRTELDPDQFGVPDLWRESIALGQELPIVPNRSIMYADIVSRTGRSTLASPTITWVDRSSRSKIEFADTRIVSNESEISELQEAIKNTMGEAVINPYSTHILNDCKVWGSKDPEGQADHARRFARSAQSLSLEVLTKWRKRVPELYGRGEEASIRSNIIRITRVNLALARLVGDSDLSPYEDIAERAQTWTQQANRPAELSWLL